MQSNLGIKYKMNDELTRKSIIAIIQTKENNLCKKMQKIPTPCISEQLNGEKSDTFLASSLENTLRKLS